MSVLFRILPAHYSLDGTHHLPVGEGAAFSSSPPWGEGKAGRVEPRKGSLSSSPRNQTGLLEWAIAPLHHAVPPFLS